MCLPFIYLLYINALMKICASFVERNGSPKSEKHFYYYENCNKRAHFWARASEELECVTATSAVAEMCAWARTKWLHSFVLIYAAVAAAAALRCTAVSTVDFRASMCRREKKKSTVFDCRERAWFAVHRFSCYEQRTLGIFFITFEMLLLNLNASDTRALLRQTAPTLVMYAQPEPSLWPSGRVANKK